MLPVCVLLVGMSLAGCLDPVRSLYPPSDPALAKPVYVVRHGWHTRIAVRQADVPPAVWPESEAFGDVEYLEIGWGDRAYYQADEPTVAMALNAVLRPTPAALHVAAFRAPICEARAGYPIVRIEVSPRGVDRLAQFIHASYAHDDDGRPVPTRPGHDPLSSFYLATGSYHTFNTSNNWTAKALRATGAPVTPSVAIFSWNVMFQARRVGMPACHTRG